MSPEFCEALVWVLLHSVWQGIVIAGIVSGMLAYLPARCADARYRCGLAGLFGMIICILVTWSLQGLRPDDSSINPQQLTALRSPGGPALKAPFASHENPHQKIRAPIPTTEAAEITSSPVSELNRSQPSEPSIRQWMPWMVLVWIVGAGLMLARSITAIVLVGVWRTPRPQLAAPGLERLVAIKDELCVRFNLRRVITVMLSDRVRVPSVIGTIWPCILIPPALLTGIPLDQWRIILAHELAHIRRYDFLINVVQMLIESLLFFNPAVWWVSRQIRIEREACCDALAVELCGQPLSVARTLVEFAAQMRGDARWSRSSLMQQATGTAATASSAVIAFADEDAPGELTDRVHRLVKPELAAQPRVSWLGLSVVLSCLLLAAVILSWGTSLAVRTAAHLMSPKERVEKLERIQSEAQGIFLPPEPKPTQPQGDPVIPAVPGDRQADSRQCEITLIVRTADGKPLPKELDIRTNTNTGNSTGGASIETPREEMQEFRKVLHFNPCRLRIGAVAPGYAVVASPVISLFPNDQPQTVELVLSQGYGARLKIHDADGRPVAGVLGKLEASLKIGSGSVGVSVAPFTSDSGGIAPLEHLGDVAYTIRLRAPGFEQLEVKLDLQPDALHDIELKRSVPVKLRVVDAESGAPVSGARVVIAVRRKSGDTYYFSNPRHVPPTDTSLNFGVSDAQGQVILDELMSGARYTFGVIAPGYAAALLEEVTPGQAPAEVRLNAPVKLTGRIEGSLDGLTSRTLRDAAAPQKIVNYTMRYKDVLYDSGTAPVSADGKFEINDLIAGERLTITAGTHSEEVIVAQTPGELVLKLDAPVANAAAFPKREVIIRLTGTSEGAPARGRLYVRYQHPDPACQDVQNGPLPLQANQVTLQVPLGATLGFEPQNLVGYRLEKQENIPIVAGNGPQMIDVPVTAAGGIHGRIRRPDGSPADGAFVRVYATKLPPGFTDQHKLNPDSSSASSSYLATLPFGGRYVILAREFNEQHSAWCVSEEITISASHPIAEADLQLRPGRSIEIKVLDPAGKPISGQETQVTVEFSLRGRSSLSSSFKRFTGPDGIARFEHVSFDAPISPLACELRAEVSNSKFVGWQSKIDPSRPIEVKLKAGLTVSGVLIEAGSGKRVPNATLRILPRNFSEAKFRSAVHTKTNSRGEFRFEGLEPMEYQGYVDDASPKGAIITPVPEGGIRINYPAGVEQLQLDASTGKDVKWEVIIHPNGQLKLAN